MLTRTMRRLPAVVLVVLLAVLTLRTWLDVEADPVRTSGRVDGLHSITWAANVATSGRLAVRITYDLGDDTPRTLSIRLPDGARYLEANDVAIPASSGKYASVSVSRSVTVGYELPGAVTRYRDGALLRMLGVDNGSIEGDQGLFPCPRCYLEPSGYGDIPVYGSLSLPGADQVQLAFVHLNSIRSEADPGEIRFAGIDSTGDDVSLVAVLPGAAVAELPVRDGTVAQALDATQAEVRSADQTLHRPTVPEHGSRAAAIMLTVLLAAIIAWIAVRTIWTAGTRAAARAAGVADTTGLVRAVRPSALEPALVGAVVGDAVRGDRSVVAATVVELARRNVVSFSGNDARRFTLTIPAGATGTTRFEQAVLDCLRGSAPTSEAVERVGPPLWGTDGTATASTLRRALLREAMREKLIRISPPAVLLVPVTIAMGVIGIIGSVGGSAYAWFVTIVGSLLALAVTMSSGLVLTTHGRAEQAEWLRYAQWLRNDDANANLAQAEPWNVGNYGDVLAYAAALGAAPEVVRALSPRPGARS